MPPTTRKPMSEAVEIRLRRSRSWLNKARRTADLDSQFIFLWIALNALYGRPRYRGDVPSDETHDLAEFLRAVEDNSRAQVAATLRGRDVEGHVEKVLQSPFLNIECWRAWDRANIRDRARRKAVACNTYQKQHPTVRVFLQLYTLRNQVLHGAATDGGQRNRESLKTAVPILSAAVEALIALVKEHHAKIPWIDSLPYPPSIGDGGQFNPPRPGR